MVVHNAVRGNGESGEGGKGEGDCEFHRGMDDGLGRYKAAGSAGSGPLFLT